MQAEIKKLQNLFHSSKNIVFFGGAGVSTESGIPDFRSIHGIYNQPYPYPPETILSHSFLISSTRDFYSFYREKILLTDAKPNKAHYQLSILEKKNKLKAVITQNIDGLHQAAGSKNVLELHGSVHRNYCLKCKRLYGVEAIINSQGIPRCKCGEIIRPDVVLYGESLDSEILQKAIEYISRSDVLIVGGTSLAVYPAAGLINYYRGNKLVLINKSPTPMDEKADILMHGCIGEILGGLEL